MAALETPACPYCGANWTAAMLELLDRHSGGPACACCMAGPLIHLAPVMPGQDLCCESCGKPIYRAPGAVTV
jgi:hypothetical protein